MMIRTLEEDTYGFWAEFGHRPGGARGEDAGATWFRSGVPFVNYNGVVGVGCDIDAMLARVRAWNLPARWIVSSANAGYVEAVLAERGLETVDEAPGMVARIKDLPEPPVSAYALQRCGGCNRAVALEPRSCRGVRNRRAPRFRRRGFGAFATLLTVREGAKRGASVAVLQATKEGFPVYAKLGFQTVCSFRSWQIA